MTALIFLSQVIGLFAVLLAGLLFLAVALWVVALLFARWTAAAINLVAGESE